MIKAFLHESRILNKQLTIKTVYPDSVSIETILILLHGKIEPEGDFSVIENLPEEFSLQELCEACKALIIIPYMKNRYYISDADCNICEFLSSELPAWIKNTFSLQPNAEWILGGISMGGYGAVLNAAISGKFNKILSISGSFIQNDVRIGNNEIWGSMLPTPASTKGCFLEYFLPLDDLDQSVERNASSAISLFRTRDQKPSIILTCGTEDWLFPRNQKMLRALKEQDLSPIFIVIPAENHDSYCFKKGLWEAMKRWDSSFD